MNAIGKIGVIMPEITDPLSHDMVNGIYSRAKALGYDVIIFTGVYNSQLEFQYDSYIIGLENIYELICRCRLDGILYAADLFYNEQTKKRIYDILRMTNVPCLILGEEHDGFESVFTSQYESMKMLTRHLIDVHNYRKFGFLSGLPNHHDSIERFDGFSEALREFGIEFDESLFYYGYFWKDEPKKYAQKIISGEIAKPDAVVCANDVMAIALVEELKANGVRVPEDIAVVGCDGGWDAYSCEPQITTICGRNTQQGSDAVDRIYELMGGSGCTVKGPRQYIRYGTSCGCGDGDYLEEKRRDTSMRYYIKNRFGQNLALKVFMASDIISNLTRAASMEQLIIDIDHMGYLLPKWKWLDICLCTDWMIDFDNPDNFRQQGFSDMMHHILSKRYPVNNLELSDFPTEQLVPELQKPHEPLLLILTSLHNGNQIFGYMSTAYDNTDGVCIDDRYVNWTDAVCNGLCTLQRKLYQDYQKHQLEQLSIHDSATGLYNKKGFMERLPEFTKSCSQQNKVPFLLLLSNVCRGDSSEQLGIDESLIIANALRLSASGNEVYARLSDNVFAVMLAAEIDEECKKITEDRILALERKIQYIQGSVAGMQMPELISSNCSIFCEENSMEAMMDQQLIRITEKAAAAANRFQDYRDQLQKLRRDIYLNPQEDWSVPAVLKRVGISRSHFHRVYKEQFAVSYIEDIIQARLDKAQQLLMYTDMRIQEIAEQCGYSNENHFMRQFKSKFGITPLIFVKTKHSLS